MPERVCGSGRCQVQEKLIPLVLPPWSVTPAQRNPLTSKAFVRKAGKKHFACLIARTSTSIPRGDRPPRPHCRPRGGELDGTQRNASQPLPSTSSQR